MKNLLFKKKKEIRFKILSILVLALLLAQMTPMQAFASLGDVGTDTDEDGNTYTYTDNGDGTATITAFVLNGPTDIEIPETLDGLTVTIIGNGVFREKGIAGVVIPDGLTSIGEFAFYGNDIADIAIPENVISIGQYAFYGNDIASVTIPKSVMTVGYGAFWNNRITSATVLNKFTDVRWMAFHGNASEIVIYGHKFSDIEMYVDDAGEGFTFVSLDFEETDEDGNTYYFYIDNGEVVIMDFERSGPTDIVIPDTYSSLPITRIGIEAFSFEGLTSVVIPESIAVIDDMAFYFNEMTDVTIENRNVIIGEDVFTYNQEDPLDFNIHGYAGSTAETYADDNGYTFIDLGSGGDAAAAPEEGDGSEGHPYEIASAENLIWLSQQVNSGTFDGQYLYFIQTADIDLSGYPNFIPIGSRDDHFTGTYDGDDYKITNLTISEDRVVPGDECEVYYGLFGYAEDSELKNITLEDISFDLDLESDGDEVIFCHIGGIAGMTDCCSIQNCKVLKSESGTTLIRITGTGDKTSFEAGGIVGSARISEGNFIEKTVNQADITATFENGEENCIGGIAGKFRGETGDSGIRNCLNNGDISVDGDMTEYQENIVGGIVGSAWFGSIVNSLNIGTISDLSDDSADDTDKRTAGITGIAALTPLSGNFYLNTSAGYGIGIKMNPSAMEEFSNAGAEPKTDAELRTPLTFTGWDQSVWKLVSGSYPAIEEPVVDPVAPQGEGTASDPYLIAEPGNLLWMSAQSPDENGFRNKYFKQTGHIDMSAVGNFTPIAIMGSAFQGKYDGCGYKISNLTIEAEEQSDVGLFAAIGVMAEIKRLTLEDVGISAGYLSGPNSNANIGGIAGASTGKILDCHIRNSAEGQSRIVFAGKESYTGGIVGSNSGTVSRCSNAADISSGGTGGIYAHFIGGIAGINVEGAISECFNSGNISGSESNTDRVCLAGIAGRNYFWYNGDGTVGSCYSAGTLTINDTAAWNSKKAGITIYTTNGDNISDSFYLDSTADNGFEALAEEVVNTDGARSEAGLKSPATFAGWDADTWTLTAGSLPELKPVFFVTYDGNDSDGGTAPTDNRNYSQGSTVTVLDNTGNLARTGYTFGGWNTAADGNGTGYAAGVSFTMGASDATLYAKWTSPSPVDNGNNNGGRHTQTPAPANNAPITINGRTLQQGATVSTQLQSGRTTTTVTLDTQRTTEIINSGQTGSVVEVPITGKTDAAVGVLTGQLVKAMENKQAVLEIRTDTAAYTLPAQQINIDAISAELGPDAELSDIQVSIRIINPPEETVRVIENEAEAGGYSIVVPPIEFSVTASYGTRSVEINRFNAYVDRTVAIPDGVDPTKITTAVVADPDGTVRHVPTKIIVIDGRYYAQISSLTNSVYSVIWNPVEFTDAAKHWAKDAINDMGSRMVVSGDGNGNYAPDRDITRAEFAAIVVKALGLQPGKNENNPFGDVKDTAWYGGCVKAAYEYGIITGYDNNLFKPQNMITREQAMTMVGRAMDVTGLKTEEEIASADAEKVLTAYIDAGQVSNYAKSGAAACIDSEIINGKGANRIAPKENITRAEVAVIIKRLLEKSGLI